MKLPDVPLPRHAYLPGMNKRHPDDAFDVIRETAVQGLNADQLARCRAFQTGLYYLDSGYYWEAHEVLEPVWMALPDGTVERHLVQGLIQLANGRLKLRMGRPKAALRLVGLARGLVPAEQCGPAGVPTAPRNIMSLDVSDVHRWIDDLESQINLAI